MLIRFASLVLLVALTGCATKTPIAVVEDLSPTAQPLAEGLKATYQNGLVLLQDGEYEEAVVFWKELAETHPDLPGVWTNLGLALYRTGEYQASLDALAHVDEINAALEAQLSLAQQQAPKVVDEAKEQIVEADGNGANVDASTDVAPSESVGTDTAQSAMVGQSGLTQEELNAEPPAEDGADQVDNETTDDGSLVVTAEVKEGNLQVETTEVVASIGPAMAKPIMLKPYCPVHRVRALPQRELGLFAEAEESYQAAIACNPTDAESYYNLGILFDLYRNDLVSALAQYKQAKALMGDDKTLDVWIADLERRSGTEVNKE